MGAASSGWMAPRKRESADGAPVHMHAPTSHRPHSEPPHSDSPFPFTDYAGICAEDDADLARPKLRCQLRPSTTSEAAGCMAPPHASRARRDGGGNRVEPRGEGGPTHPWLVRVLFRHERGVGVRDHVPPPSTGDPRPSPRPCSSPRPLACSRTSSAVPSGVSAKTPPQFAPAGVRHGDAVGGALPAHPQPAASRAWPARGTARVGVHIGAGGSA
jgi:hypothetical protein